MSDPIETWTKGLEAAGVIPEKIDSVPNAPKTPVSSYRVPLELKAEFKELSELSGDDMTAVVVDAIRTYVKKKRREHGR